MHKTCHIVKKYTDYGRMFKNTVCIEQTWRLTPFPCGSPCLQSQLRRLFPIKQTRNETQETNGHTTSVRFVRLQSGSLSKQKNSKSKPTEFRIAFGPGAKDDHHPVEGKGRPSNANRPVHTI